MPGEDADERDVELGERAEGRQETGITLSDRPNVTDELDHWDENAEDWDESEQRPKAPSKADDQPITIPNGVPEGPKSGE